MAKPKTTSCHCCDGSGKELDHRAVGDMMKKRRIAAGLSQREVSRRLGMSGPYICDLELGRRPWTDTRIKLYEKALE